ncbi:MAG: nucleotidyltransferase family protein [Anaerolineae bacterium]|nr:nucleotidyltransferase family protein [Anaerolineae bacterium]
MEISPDRLSLPIPTDAIAAFCRRHHIQELALFGSVLRDDFGPNSDVDVLITFEPGADENLTLMDLAGMQLDLSSLLQRDVDLVMRDGLKPYIKDDVLKTLEVIYAI